MSAIQAKNMAQEQGSTCLIESTLFIPMSKTL